MSRRLSQVIVFAIAVVFAAAPFVLAQTSGAGSATSGPMGTGTTGTPGATGTTGTSSQMGTMGTQDTINATVADVNHQHNTVKLRMQGGETVEFKVPEQAMMSLNKGDSVQVSIRKAEGQPSMGSSTAPAHPESTAPGAGTKSR